MNDEETKLLDLVNTSGFPFQLRVENEIRLTSNRHDWHILASEHQWRDPESGDNGYVDMILSRDVTRLIVECKRVRDGTWIFLVPHQQGTSYDRERVCFLSSIVQPGQHEVLGWNDGIHLPVSKESAFCVIRGQDDKDRPMLERLSGMIMRSVESVAEEEISFTSNSVREIKRHYFGVLVTNANLMVCGFDPKQVGLENGELPEGTFDRVPFMRFRKTMATKYPSLSDNMYSLETSSQLSERTVLIVQASHLSDFLSRFSL